MLMRQPFQVAVALLFFGLRLAIADKGAVGEDPASTALVQDQLASELADELQNFGFAAQDADQEPIKLPPFTPRHHHEKEKLLQRMRKDTGKYTSNHPRHRLLDALHGFSKYYDRQKEEVDRLKGLYKNVSKSQKALLENNVRYSHRFTEAEHLLMVNHDICSRIVKTGLEWYDITESELKEHIRDVESKGRKAEKISVSQALKHIVRDWAKEGEYERVSTFPCVLASLKTITSGDDNMKTPKILVPGAGLGRLGYDIAAAFPSAQVTINEWSMYMNLVSRYLETNPDQLHTSIHPFIDSWSHHTTWKNQQRGISFPEIDVNTRQVVLVEGDFTTAFNEEAGQYDIIVTYFFIDTARNLITYFETIRKLLRPGGYWVNLGPLLYGSAPFVQLSLQEIVVVVEAMGFEFLETDGEVCGPLTWPERRVRNLKAIYSFDERALSESAYKAQFWIVQKKQ